MAVPVDAGTSEIVFTYKTPGLSSGMIISASALCILIIYLAVCYVWRKKQGATVCYPVGEELLSRWEKELCDEASVSLIEEDFNDALEENDQETEEISDDL